MTFVSKHGRRTSTEDLYRQVLLRGKCLATVLLLHCCTFVLGGQTQPSPATMTAATGRNNTDVSSKTRGDHHHPRLLEVAPPQITDLETTRTTRECSHEVVVPTSRNNESNASVVASGGPTNGSRLRPAPPSLPRPFSSSRSYHQCLYLDELSAENACGPAMRSQVHLRFCSQYHLGHLLSEGESCGPTFLGHVRELDESARLLANEFEQLLELYDCDTSYSVSWNCRQCKKVYRQWICSMVLPFHRGGQLLKPCRLVCHLVEQMCPYFHPSVKEQYAGERVFKCIDPDIPDLESIRPHSVFGLPGHCYCPHHLDAATENLKTNAIECELITRTGFRTNAKPPVTTITNFKDTSSISGDNSSVSITSSPRDNNNNITNHTMSSHSASSRCACSLLLLLAVTLYNSRTSFSSLREPT